MNFNCERNIAMNRSLPKTASVLLGLSLIAGLSGCPSSNNDAQQTDTTTTTTTTTSSASPAASADTAASPAASPATAASPAAASPAATKTLVGNAANGPKLFVSKTCSTCHTITKVAGATGTIGPKLDGLASRAGTRKPGMSAEDYIKESIEKPGAFVVPTFANAMTPTIRSTMTDQEFADLVAFLKTL